MSALPPRQMRAMRRTAASSDRPECALARRWSDLHASAAKLAGTAGLKPETEDERPSAFPALIGKAGDWQREMARQGIEDMDAMMRPGLAALDSIAMRGLDPLIPALALWREFYLAREAVLALIPDHSDPAAAA